MSVKVSAHAGAAAVLLLLVATQVAIAMRIDAVIDGYAHTGGVLSAIDALTARRAQLEGAGHVVFLAIGFAALATVGFGVRSVRRRTTPGAVVCLIFGVVAALGWVALALLAAAMPGPAMVG